MLEKLRFHNEPVVVTGAGGGIGGACCVALAELGATVIRLDNNKETLVASEANISKSAATKAYIIDVSDEKRIDEVRLDIEAQWGHIKALINCAGVNFKSTVVDLSTDKWREIMAVQLDAVFFMCRAFIPLLLKAANGSVLNISSPFGIIGHPKSAVYSAAKGAVMALTRQMAADGGRLRPARTARQFTMSCSNFVAALARLYSIGSVRHRRFDRRCAIAPFCGMRRDSERRSLLNF